MFTSKCCSWNLFMAKYIFVKTQRTEIIRCSEKVFIISFNIAKAYLLLHTVVEISLHMKASVWSKTSLNAVGMGGAGVDPPTCKMRAFFLMSLTLTESMSRVSTNSN